MKPALLQTRGQVEIRDGEIGLGRNHSYTLSHVMFQNRTGFSCSAARQSAGCGEGVDRNPAVVLAVADAARQSVASLPRSTVIEALGRVYVVPALALISDFDAGPSGSAEPPVRLGCH